jgi:general secretion pathway protein D
MIRYFLLFLFCLSFGYAKALHINFNNITTQNLIKITAKLLDTNIFFTTEIGGKVNFVTNGKIDKSNILQILSYDLQTKGYKIEKQNDDFIIKKEEIVTAIIPIKHLEAKAVLKELEKLLSSEYLKPVKLQSSISLNKQNNAVILVGSNKFIHTLKNLVQKLDAPQQQVYVEAKILEVSRSKVENFGVQYGLNGFNSDGSTLTTLSSMVNGSDVVNPLSLSELGLYGYSPLSMKYGLSLGVAINLLNQNKALNVVSEPSLLCINNQQSSIYVGETQAIATGTTVGTTTTTNYQREDIGLKLSVTPRIVQNKKVTLQINTVLEDIKKTQSTIIGIPNTDKKEIITTAIVNNGESVVVGGLIKNKLENIEDNIPFFSDIPLFGELFKNNYQINDKINLIIIMTPYIIPKEKDITFIRDQLARLEILTQKITAEVDQKLKQKQVFKQNDQPYKQHNEMIKKLFNL